MNLFLFIWLSLSIFFTIHLYKKKVIFFDDKSILDYFFLIMLIMGLSTLIVAIKNAPKKTHI